MIYLPQAILLIFISKTSAPKSVLTLPRCKYTLQFLPPHRLQHRSILEGVREEGEGARSSKLCIHEHMLRKGHLSCNCQGTKMLTGKLFRGSNVNSALEWHPCYTPSSSILPPSHVTILVLFPMMIKTWITLLPPTSQPHFKLFLKPYLLLAFR